MKESGYVAAKANSGAAIQRYRFHQTVFGTCDMSQPSARSRHPTLRMRLAVFLALSA